MGTRRRTATADDRRPGRRLPVACSPAALALLGLLAYIGTVGTPFIYDDHNALVEAAAIARGTGHPELAASLDRQLEQVQQGWPPSPEARTDR